MRRILIHESTQRGNVINLEGNIGLKRIELMCFSNESSCKKLSDGEYFFRFTTPFEGVYTDCINVVLYDTTAQKIAEDSKGIFCLHGEIQPQ